MTPASQKKPSVKRPPRPSGQFMDFAPRRSTSTRTVSVRSVSAQSVSVRQASARPTSAHPTRQATMRSTIVRQTSARPAPTHPVQSTRSAHPRSTVTRQPVRHSVARPRPARPAPAPKAVFYEETDVALGVIEDLDANHKKETPVQPQNKSPFINTEKLEKRPLSALRNSPKPIKNTYQSRKDKRETPSTPTMVTTGPSKGSNFALAIAIFFTIILGALVGAIAYLAFFQN